MKSFLVFLAASVTLVTGSAVQSSQSQSLDNHKGPPTSPPHHVVPAAASTRSGSVVVRQGHKTKSARADAMPSLESLSPKRFFDFITDPSLLITVLHSLEVAYWTFPFGFILTPVINFFRVPNRKRSLEVSRVERILEKMYSQRDGSVKDNHFYRTWGRLDALPPQEKQRLHDLYIKFLDSLAQQELKLKLGSSSSTSSQEIPRRYRK